MSDQSKVIVLRIQNIGTCLKTFCSLICCNSVRKNYTFGSSQILAWNLVRPKIRRTDKRFSHT